MNDDKHIFEFARKSDGWRQNSTSIFNFSLLAYIVMLICFWFIAPKFSEIFKELGRGEYLPSSTKLYLVTSRFLYKAWYLGLVPLFAMLIFKIKARIDIKLKTKIYLVIGIACIIIILGGFFAMSLPLACGPLMQVIPE